jgi:hypothetical protein
MVYILKVPVKITHPALPNPGLNVWHLRLQDGIEAPSPQQAGEALSELHSSYDTWLATLSGLAVFSFDGEVTTEEAEPRAYDIGFPWAAGNQGAGQVLPPANCIVAGWGTGLATRRGRGRTFLGPLQATAVQADGTPSQAALDNIRAGQDSLLAYNQANPGDEWGLWSRTAQTFRPFVSRTVHDKFAVLRSRRD